MTTSSVQDICSIILSDEQLKAIDTDTLTISNGSSSYYYTPSSTYTISNGAVSTVSFTSTTSTNSWCIPPISGINITNMWGGTEWVNSFPAWGRIDEMCKEYPALKIAFEKFKHTYEMVKEDFDTPPEKRVRP